MTTVKKVRAWIPFKRFFHHFLWNVYSEIHFELEIVKLDHFTVKNKLRSEWRGIKK